MLAAAHPGTDFSARPNGKTEQEEININPEEVMWQEEPAKESRKSGKSQEKGIFIWCLSGCGRGIAGDYCGNTGISAQNFCDSRAWMCDSGYGHWYAVCLDFVAVEEKRSKNIRKSGNPNAKGKQKVWKTVPEAYGNI